MYECKLIKLKLHTILPQFAVLFVVLTIIYVSTETNVGNIVVFISFIYFVGSLLEDWSLKEHKQYYRIE